VLVTHNTPIDQFYSGLVLSAILAPIALLIRSTGSECSRFHPFAIASTTPITIADFDRMADPGSFAIGVTFKYSIGKAFVRAVLMLSGFLLVPLGTLILTTGSYTPPTRGQSVLPIPTRQGGLAPLHVAMNYNTNVSSKGFEPLFTDKDIVLSLATSAYSGSLSSVTDQFPVIPRQIGPRPQFSVALGLDVVYEDVVSYSWAGNCVDAAEEVPYAISEAAGVHNVNFTFHDGSQRRAYLSRSSAITHAAIYMFSDATRWIQGIPVGGTDYYAIASLAHTPNTDDYERQRAKKPNATGLVLDQGIWISRVKCRASFTWELASCRWDGEYMQNCTRSPNQNATGLDTVALDALSLYMSAIPWKLYLDKNIMYSYAPWSGYLPITEHYNTLNGMCAIALVSVATRVEWGKGAIRTLGGEAKQVYILRLPFLITIVGMLLLSMIVAAADYVHSVVTRTPLTKPTFIAIANAVRGEWWDQELQRIHTLPSYQSRKAHSTTVMLSGHNSGGYTSLVPKDQVLD
jgi:hypothetical protein